MKLTRQIRKQTRTEQGFSTLSIRCLDCRGWQGDMGERADVLQRFVEQLATFIRGKQLIA